MEYLYIPTTTLNFNNILSTGSISPAAVYALRGFGYKQFEVVEPNPYKNVLFLYDRCPVFVIEDAERDSHPLILRMRADRLPLALLKQTGRKGDVTVYACDETIYFDPTSTNLFFLTPEAKRVALTKAEPSLTTKLVEVYQPLMQICVPGEPDSFEWSQALLGNALDTKSNNTPKCCEADDRINRLKGFTFGYILGSYKSINPRVAELAQQVRRLSNKASALMNDPSSSFSNAQCKDTNASLITLERVFTEAGIGTRRFNPQGGDRIEIDHCGIAKVRDRSESNVRYTKSLLRLVNDYCLISNFSGHLDEERMDVALAGAKAIRAIIGNKWEGSAYQMYINALLNNIKSGSAFDFNESNNLAMQSFAAFVLKGDDLERLETFLISKGIGDFRIAFALWGAMFGFSKIPKTIFNLPFTHDDAAYAKKMNLYVHSVVHGIPLNDPKQPPPVEQPPTETAEPGTGKPSMASLDQLKLALPGCTTWLVKLEELLNACGGLTKKFITLLKKTKVGDLGEKPEIRTTKKDVVAFFEDTLKSQTQASRRQAALPLGQQRSDVFWSDEHAWDVIREVASLGEEERIKEDLEWFQHEWQSPKSKHYGWQNEDETNREIKNKTLEQRTNADAIYYFCRILRRKIEGRQNLLDQTIADIKRVLEDSYH